MRRFSLIFLLFVCFLSASGQDEVVDSLNTVLGGTIPDSTRVMTLLELSGQYYRSDSEQAKRLAMDAKELAEKIDFKSGVALSYKAIGMSHYFQNNWVDALVNWKDALRTFEAIKDLNGVSNMLNNLGAVHFNGGDDKAALDYYLKSLRVAEEYKDTLRTVTALMNIGTVYLTKESSKPMAFTYYKRALPLSRALGDHDANGNCADNMG